MAFVDNKIHCIISGNSFFILLFINVKISVSRDITPIALRVWKISPIMAVDLEDRVRHSNFYQVQYTTNIRLVDALTSDSGKF